jgi:hypothetical protein
MAIDADTPNDVVDAFVLPGACPKCGNQHTDLITDFQAQVIEAALAPPASTITVTDDTTDEELSAFVRGKRRG